MKLRAATLLETLVAMALLGGVLATAVLIFSNVVEGDRSNRRTRARLAADDMFARIEAAQRVALGELEKDGFTIRIDQEILSGEQRSVKVTVVEGDGTILEAQRILPGPWRD
ncbi:MAG: type II secretion system protein [Flavobacteriales bacterium]